MTDRSGPSPVSPIPAIHDAAEIPTGLPAEDAVHGFRRHDPGELRTDRGQEQQADHTGYAGQSAQARIRSEGQKGSGCGC